MTDNRGTRGLAVLACLALLLGPSAALGQGSFTAFETGQVRPLALSPDGNRLYAVNTPDNRLEIFRVAAGGVSWLTSVPVGLEPASVAVRSADEVWVVNHLSDSISIVDVAASPPRVKRTLFVGDEPRDIVFGRAPSDTGNARSRAFITTAHRGQNNPRDPQLTTPGVGRADVWVFDANNLGSPLGGTPLTVITLFGDTPRALAVTPDGNTVYAAVFHSGNQTTTIGEGPVCDGFGGSCLNLAGIPPGGLPGPRTDVNGDRAVDFADLVVLAQNYNTVTGMTYADGDFNYDGAVDFEDLVLLAQRYNTVLPVPPAPAPPSTAVTERRDELAPSESVPAPVAKPVRPAFSTRRVAR